jgi:hypothetical protein
MGAPNDERGISTAHVRHQDARNLETLHARNGSSSSAPRPAILALGAVVLLSLGLVVGYRYALYSVDKEQRKLREELEKGVPVEAAPARTPAPARDDTSPTDFETRPVRHEIGDRDTSGAKPDPNAKRCSAAWCRVEDNKSEMCCQLE